MISPDLLEILACPVCHERLALKDNGAALKCDKCHRLYPIRDDIPVLLVEEAVVEPS